MPSLAKHAADLSRNGRWGTCGSCTDSDPAECEGTDGGDHQFTPAQFVEMVQRQFSEPECHPQVLRALRAELHQHAGGHQREVQADAAKLTTVTARCLLHTLQRLRNANTTMRSQPWRIVL